ncbi:SRPBCC domain-containing protein [Brevundimonas sp.]|uniref:SRPBCC family protein n=1 Tax=Brevundimonas sp. TaxID=1871086 RepID=UPI002ED95E09
MTVAAAIPEALRRLSIVRTFDAPRALVWKMWTDPAHVAAWWGPEHFTTPVVRMDVRPGGAIHMVMRGPDGADFPFDGRFVAVEEPERLVMRTWVRREDGTTWFDVEQSFRFEEMDGQTRLHLDAVVIEAGADALGPLTGMEAGWTQSLDKLEAHVLAVTGD